MAKFLSLTTLLLLATFNFSSISCQFYLDPVNYIPRESGSGRFHMQRKASDLKEMSTSEFSKEFDTRMENHPVMKVQESKVSQRRQAPVNTHQNNKRIARKQINGVDLPDKKESTGNKGWNGESEEVENNDPTSSQTFEVIKTNLKEGLEYNTSDESAKPSGEEDTCNEKCFTPKCEVKCEGNLVSAACKAPGCKAFTRGEDSASLCSGESCQAECYQKDCISGCEGNVCFVKCQGKYCHAVSEGSKSGSICIKDGCMAYGNGNRTNIQCEGSFCQAQCLGEKCSASENRNTLQVYVLHIYRITDMAKKCNGTSCVAGCTGKDCKAKCKGKKCQQIQQLGQPAVDFGKGSSEDDDDNGYYGNKNFINRQNRSEIAEQYKNKETPKASRVDEKKDLYEDGKVRLGYEINIQLTPSSVMYIRDKIYQLIKVARFMRYNLPMRQ